MFRRPASHRLPGDPRRPPSRGEKVFFSLLAALYIGLWIYGLWLEWPQG